MRLRPLLVMFVCVGSFTVAAAWQNAGPNSKDPVAPLAEAKPRFWKGNLHTHSFWSDGDDFPEMVADWYRRHGYDFLTLSDHNILSEGDKWVEVSSARHVALKKYLARFGTGWVERRQDKEKQLVRLKPLREFRSVLEEPGRFLLIPGEEITHRYARSPVHMNGINLRDVIKPINGDSVAETISVNNRAAAEQARKTAWPNIVFLNHPNFGYGVRAEDLVLAQELRFFEVFNGHPGVNNYGDKARPGCERLWDIALALRLGKFHLPVLYGLATDDAHGYHVYGVGKVNPGRGWVCVRARHLTAESVVRGMDEGDYYASTGVVLDDVVRSREGLTVKIHPEPGVKYQVQFIGTRKGANLAADAPAKDGKATPATGTYSNDIGAVLTESDSLTASYRLTGQELYVRAKIVSSKPHPNPFKKGDVEVAWTQPAVP